MMVEPGPFDGLRTSITGELLRADGRQIDGLLRLCSIPSIGLSAEPGRRYERRCEGRELS